MDKDDQADIETVLPPSRLELGVDLAGMRVCI